MYEESSSLPKNKKVKIHTTIILPLFHNERGTLSLTRTNIREKAREEGAEKNIWN
jgi:hypothetical protein